MTGTATGTTGSRATTSAIYEGTVRHRRTLPVAHEFNYRIFMMYLDLDELPRLFDGCPGWAYERWAPATFRRGDYYGPEQLSIDAAVRDEVERRSGVRPSGPIRMLTNMRYLGLCFNPVTFYYCFDETGKRVETILAEITNTPWGERHAYVLVGSKADRRWTVETDRGSSQSVGFRFQKVFHVSPFIDMDVEYDWRFSTPGDRLVVQMDDLKQGQKFFDATLVLKRREITPWALTSTLLRHPWNTGKTVAAIYWQAMRLRLKKCPFLAHPKHGVEEHADTRNCA